jgi:flagella basal body P-ring formation protein FlgA
MKKITAIIIGVLLPAACFAMNAAGQKSAKNLIMTAVINEIKKEAPKNAAISVEFEKPQLINVFDGAVSITAGTRGSLSGEMRFYISGYVDGKKMDSYIPVLVRAVCPVIVASRTLEARTMIRGTDLSMADKDIATMSFMPFFAGDADKITGMLTSKALQKARVIGPSDVQPVPVISQGDLVTITCNDENMHMEVQGRAEGQGAVGETIEVRNTASKKLVMATVVSQSMVRVGEGK